MNLEKENKQNLKSDLLPIWIYFGITVGASFILGIIFAILKIELDMTIIQLIPQSLIFIVLIFLYYKRIKEDMLKITKKNLIFTIIISFILILLNFGISTLFEHLNVNMDNQNTLNDIFLKYKIFTTLDIVLFAPFIEEFVFRYSIGSAIENKTIFLLLSTFIFAIMHGVGVATILYIIIGFCLAYTYLKTNKNIVYPILIHILNNTFAVITMFLALK